MHSRLSQCYHSYSLEALAVRQSFGFSYNYDSSPLTKLAP
ncbi:hypothetical protein COMA2_20417 [Candidatus Nitrospira nitrificans]|uniref:Uncharacterized protein n=1 Tax=Candidatus Nitrospira nitrificans TaxID=1742973 RepID=A0A0S4LDX8_9BACT|nr:hypothetical protein COMA2_20417 [Candidatus Nitrospira nitrificans]